ncbi:hypothetical protein FHS31_001398 [Sphingomonas vulcanisoli]|uniref:DUF2334 domain-containing protein n=1 Tax=Sphingomonas vulcanisoli TaxID=1658060 RepID=A0ABX0TRT2_9SPHN|nr:polysaccharide deacetylase family protein [Sphingomonas vulcanisoli]NIJ07788.1 hypothetical protein [Sphingomonas vulcanisoli]
MPHSAEKQLLVSIHDVSPAFEPQVDRLLGRLTGLMGSHRLAMLVVPDHWGRAPLGAAPAFARRLRGWADAGVEMFLHGWYHRDETAHAGQWDRFKARHFTASEGEFLGLSEAVAEQRIAEGLDLIEQATGRSAAGFIAPAWLYGPGAKAALTKLNVPIAEDHLRVWRPATGEVLAKGPVLTWASRSRWRTTSSLAATMLGRIALRHQPVVRIAVHPGDTHKSLILADIDHTMRHFLKTHRPARYADLGAPALAAAA